MFKIPAKIILLIFLYSYIKKWANESLAIMGPSSAPFLNRAIFVLYTDLANGIESAPKCEWSALPPATPQKYRSLDVWFFFALRNILNKE